MASNRSVSPAPAEPDIAAMTRKELAQARVRFIAWFSVALVRKPAGQSQPRIGVADRQPDWLRNQQFPVLRPLGPPLSPWMQDTYHPVDCTSGAPWLAPVTSSSRTRTLMARACFGLIRRVI